MPIATPMSACLSAGASFTPSPVIATTWPSRLQRADQPQLVLGRDAGEHVVAAGEAADLVRSSARRARCRSRRVVRAGEAELLADGARGDARDRR